MTYVIGDSKANRFLDPTKMALEIHPFPIGNRSLGGGNSNMVYFHP